MGDILIVAETDADTVLPATLPLLGFAQRFAELADCRFDLLLLCGPEGADIADAWLGYGARNVLVVCDPRLAHPLADVYAEAIAAAARRTDARYIAGASTQIGRDVLPRAAALLDAPMLTDVLAVERGLDGLTYNRPMYAGSAIAKVSVSAERVVFSIRATSFASPRVSADGSERSAAARTVVDLSHIARPARSIALDSPDDKRPDLTAARVVVSGGRPLRDAATFERVLGGLADKFGGAVGATRAAVDAGIAPNELQVGQTGKIVAPELYIAAGVSGSVQHLAGMKDSKTIVAINTDPDAPIFDIADFGLVADLYDALPEMQRKI